MEVVGLFAALGCIELASIAVLWDVIIVWTPLNHGRIGALVFVSAVFSWFAACVIAGGMIFVRETAILEACLDAADCLILLAGVLAACNVAVVVTVGVEYSRAVLAWRRQRENRAPLI